MYYFNVTVLEGLFKLFYIWTNLSSRELGSNCFERRMPVRHQFKSDILCNLHPGNKIKSKQDFYKMNTAGQEIPAALRN